MPRVYASGPPNHENVIIGKLIPAATGLKKYRSVEIKPSEKLPAEAYRRPPTEEQLLAALEEIGTDGEGVDLGMLGMTFGDGDGEGDGNGRATTEAEEVPEVDSPLDEES